MFKALTVRRVYDKKNNTLVYIAYSSRPVEGSAKMSLSTIALFGQDVAWENVPGVRRPPAWRLAQQITSGPSPRITARVGQRIRGIHATTSTTVASRMRRASAGFMRTRNAQLSYFDCGGTPH